MKLLLRLSLGVLTFSSIACSYNPRTTSLNRRDWLGLIAASSTVVVAPLVVISRRAGAADEEVKKGLTTTSTTSTDASSSLADVYFGVGCFWHIQHEFVQAERNILGRNDHQLTSRAGYAGGKSTDKEGRVCYHNLQFIADYGRLGHGEAVGMSIPENKIADFAQVYFGLFNPRTKDRVDPMDIGGEYRSVMGLPGGLQHPVYPKIEAIASDAGFKLLAGKGDDPDTLGKQIVYVYDSNKFPFHQAEVYHQYHNDFQDVPYGREYNNLANLALEEGRLQTTGCPDRV